MKLLRIFPFTFTLMLAACDTGCAALSSAAPTLESVVQRVDTQKLLGCLDAGAPKDVAVCLGATTLTEGLRIALEEASQLAEDAQLATDNGAGAADLSDAERRALASKLDAALDRLAVEVERAK